MEEECVKIVLLFSTIIVKNKEYNCIDNISLNAIILFINLGNTRKTIYSSFLPLLKSFLGVEELHKCCEGNLSFLENRICRDENFYSKKRKIKFIIDPRKGARKRFSREIHFDKTP